MRRKTSDRIREAALRDGNPFLFDFLPEEIAGLPDERVPMLVFLAPRTLSHEYKSSVLRTLAFHDWRFAQLIEPARKAELVWFPQKYKFAILFTHSSNSS